MAAQMHPIRTKRTPGLIFSALLVAGATGVVACADDGSGNTDTTVPAASPTTGPSATAPAFTLTPDPAVEPLVLDTVLGTIDFTTMAGHDAPDELVGTKHGFAGLRVGTDQLL